MHLRCPHCGSIGEFRYLEDIVCHREVKGIASNGVLLVNGLYKTGEGYDDGTNPRLECRSCLTEFPIPLVGGEPVEVDFE